MEGLYPKDIEHLIKYLEFCKDKVRLDITKLMAKYELTEAERKRVKKYVFQYKMHINSNSINVDARLNKLFRPKLTSQTNKY